MCSSCPVGCKLTDIPWEPCCRSYHCAGIYINKAEEEKEAVIVLNGWNWYDCALMEASLLGVV